MSEWAPPTPGGGWEPEERPLLVWALLGVAALVGFGLLAFVATSLLGSDGEETSTDGLAAPAGAEAGDEVAAVDAPVEPGSTSTAGDVAAGTDADAGSTDGQRGALTVTADPDASIGTTAPAAPTTAQDPPAEDAGAGTTATEAPPTTQAPTTQAPTTEAPATTQAPTTEAPATTQPPTTEAPTTEPPATDPPMDDAPTTQPPVTQPPTTEAAPTTQAPTTQPPATQPPAQTGDDAAAQQQVLDLTNAERAKAGCPALRLDGTLNAVADGHSEDMAARNYFSHDSPDGEGPGDRVDASGYPARGWGENIAAGYRTAADVVNGWMNSEGHRRNILNCSFEELGVGWAQGGSYGTYWTQVFGIRG
ncbi:MAG: CAP domain-containing protein [Actinomycetota bacterium]